MVGGDGVRRRESPGGECGCGIWDGAARGDSLLVRSTMRGGIRARVFWGGCTVMDGRRRGTGRGGGDVGEGGRDGTKLGMVRRCGDSGKIGNSRAPCVSGGIGFPGP
jgi:hypothetical protein